MPLSLLLPLSSVGYQHRPTGWKTCLEEGNTLQQHRLERPATSGHLKAQRFGIERCPCHVMSLDLIDREIQEKWLKEPQEDVIGKRRLNNFLGTRLKVIKMEKKSKVSTMATRLIFINSVALKDLKSSVISVTNT